MQIVVQGKITGKGRPRFWKGHAVTPPATKEYEKKVKQAYLEEKGICFKTPIKVNITAYFKIRKSYTKKVKEAIRNGDKYPTIKPDIDNIGKIILDGLNKVAFEDDSQVVRLVVSKKWTDQEECVVFEINEY
ncbi:RusA family crossover junction endodeoxyribonuclease [Clostridium botulinum]|nr:RusA family crossover junction endodeoxyribonuclease [Clostridium botulinum]NFR89923.1 RusA family crossover junction endodeoxyribonuclease [Clostridium botulinum]NFT97945.1 RusA family crossover junction endodeoxyribonuclease [Clostridium botulinum]